MLLAECSRRSDGTLAAAAAGRPAGDDQLAPQKSSPTLTCINVVAGAGVQPSSQSMPILPDQRAVQGGGGLQPVRSWQQEQLARLELSPAWQRRSSGAPSPQQLSTQVSGIGSLPAGDAGGVGGEDDTTPKRLLSRQVSSVSAAAKPSLRASLASQRSVQAGLSFSFRVPDRQPTGSREPVAEEALATAGASRPSAPPLANLMDLHETPQQARARRARRSSIVQASGLSLGFHCCTARIAMLSSPPPPCCISPRLRLLQMPPEELEKIRHLEKHIRKNKLKVGGNRAG